MMLAAIGAVGAFATGVQALQIVGPDRIWIEAWRTFGFLVFAGLFGLLALFPRRLPGVWELVLFHKLAMVTFGLFHEGVAEAAFAGRVDLVLVAIIALAWWLCRGWQSWKAAT